MSLRRLWAGGGMEGGGLVAMATASGVVEREAESGAEWSVSTVGCRPFSVSLYAGTKRIASRN